MCGQCLAPLADCNGKDLPTRCGYHGEFFTRKMNNRRRGAQSESRRRSLLVHRNQMRRSSFHQQAFPDERIGGKVSPLLNGISRSSGFGDGVEVPSRYPSKP